MLLTKPEPIRTANLSTIQVAGTDDQSEGRKLIANLLYWLENADRWYSNCATALSVQNDAVRNYVEQIAQLRQPISKQIQN